MGCSRASNPIYLAVAGRKILLPLSRIRMRGIWNAKILPKPRADLGGQGAMPPRCQTLCNMTLKQHNPGVHCNKKMPPMASNYAFHFHLAFNFRLCTFKMLQLRGDSVPQASCWGSAPLETSSGSAPDIVPGRTELILLS